MLQGIHDRLETAEVEAAVAATGDDEPNPVQVAGVRGEDERRIADLLRNRRQLIERHGDGALGPFTSLTPSALYLLDAYRHVDAIR